MFSCESCGTSWLDSLPLWVEAGDYLGPFQNLTPQMLSEESASADFRESVQEKDSSNTWREIRDILPL